MNIDKLKQNISIFFNKSFESDDINIIINFISEELEGGDNIDLIMSKILFEYYPNNDPQIINLNLNQIEQKNNFIKEIILGSIQDGIDTKSFIKNFLGNNKHSSWTKIWRITKNFEQIHMTDIIINSNRCSFTQNLKQDKDIAIIEFLKIFVPNYELLTTSSYSD